MADESTAAPATPAATPTPPVKTKTGVGKIIAGIEGDVVSIGVFIGKEAGVIGKLFAKEEPAIQDALKAVSSAIQIIKTNLTEAPAIVIYLIKKADPKFDPAVFLAQISKAASALGIAESIIAPTLEQTVANLQAHASQITDPIAHNVFWTTLFNVFAIVVSPGTPWGKIVTFGVYIYNTFFKPKAA